MRFHCSSRKRKPDQRGFTLIEIMVAIGIIAIIMAIGIPSIFQQMHKDSMRLAVSELREIFNEARARAVLDGVDAEIRFRPLDRTITVVPGGGAKRDLFTDGGEVQNRAGDDAGARGLSTMKLSDHIIVEHFEIELRPVGQLEEASAFFYKNGTADEIYLLLRSDVGEVREIRTDAVTGTMEVEVKR